MDYMLNEGRRELAQAAMDRASYELNALGLCLEFQYREW